MMPVTICPIEALPAISLADLQAEAAFLTRSDRKYLAPLPAVETLLAGIDPGTRVLEIAGRRSFIYRTPYFDDEALTSYFGAARVKRDRFKVRTRLYADSGLCQLEVKVRDCRGRTVKHRVAHDLASLDELTVDDQTWLRAFPQVAPHADELRHCLTTSYRRFTLVLPDGAGRVTVDRDLVFALPGGRALSIPAVAIVETKGPGGPTAVDRLLWRQGHRPVALSKFAVG
ncbi:MAG: polyphosphate polymerase domain-containing protein, partial [Thermomicrobiales bacterium]|nr:polyphosphate polymerase domain-containing protein [Thermomicrobiales bacterium]